MIWTSRPWCSSNTSPAATTASSRPAFRRSAMSWHGRESATSRLASGSTSSSPGVEGVAIATRIDEPALSFWLDYAEREGALVEDHGDHALVLLTDPLREQSELPEEVTVTSHPDVAREDGTVLLVAGHPAVERAAGSVLAEGDTGSAYLPWPASRAPSRAILESRARAQIPIEHGRIDAAGEPIAAYLPLLRVGAMVSYAASLALRFQEQEEAWVDART